MALFNNQLANNLEKFTLGSSGLVSTAFGRCWCSFLLWSRSSLVICFSPSGKSLVWLIKARFGFWISARCNPSYAHTASGIEDKGQDQFKRFSLLVKSMSGVPEMLTQLCRWPLASLPSSGCWVIIPGDWSGCPLPDELPSLPSPYSLKSKFLQVVILQGQVARVPPDQALHAVVLLTQKLSLMKSKLPLERKTKPNQNWAA